MFFFELHCEFFDANKFSNVNYTEFCEFQIKKNCDLNRYLCHEKNYKEAEMKMNGAPNVKGYG